MRSRPRSPFDSFFIPLGSADPLDSRPKTDCLPVRGRSRGRESGGAFNARLRGRRRPAARNIRRGTTCVGAFLLFRRIVPTLLGGFGRRAHSSTRGPPRGRVRTRTESLVHARVTPRRASGDAGRTRARRSRRNRAGEPTRVTSWWCLAPSSSSLGAMTKFGERLDAEAVPAWREHLSLIHI